MAVFSDLFGFDPYVAIATVFNFLLVVGILWYFVFRPLNKSLTRRQAEISESLENAEKLKQELKEAQAESQRIIGKANQEASKIVEDYTDKARLEATEIKAQAEKDIAKAQTEANEKLAQTKQDLEEELKNQTADLALKAAKKLVMNKLDVESDKKLIEEYLDEIESEEK